MRSCRGFLRKQHDVPHKLLHAHRRHGVVLRPTPKPAESVRAPGVHVSLAVDAASVGDVRSSMLCATRNLHDVLERERDGRRVRCVPDGRRRRMQRAELVRAELPVLGGPECVHW